MSCPEVDPWMDNKDYVSREQGELPHAKAEIAYPVCIHLMGNLIGVWGPWCDYRIYDAKYVASIKTENV